MPRLGRLLLALVSVGALTGCAHLAAREADPGGLTMRLVNADYDGRILIEVAYPHDQTQPLEPLHMAVIGELAAFEEVSDRWANNWVQRQIILSLSHPGTHLIKVWLGDRDSGRGGEIIVPFEPRSGILPLWIEAELLLEPEPLRAILRFVPGLRISHNGRWAPHDFHSLVVDERSEEVDILEAVLRPGRNEFEFQGDDYRGEPIRMTRSVYYAPDRKIRVGDEFAVLSASHGSGEDPYVYLDQARIAIEGRLEDRFLIAIPDGRQYTTYRAVRPGPTTLEYRRRVPPTGREEADHIIELTVVP